MPSASLVIVRESRNVNRPKVRARNQRKSPPTGEVSGPLLPRFFLLHASASNAGKAEQPKTQKEYCAGLG